MPSGRHKKRRRRVGRIKRLTTVTARQSQGNRRKNLPHVADSLRRAILANRFPRLDNEGHAPHPRNESRRRAVGLPPERRSGLEPIAHRLAAVVGPRTRGLFRGRVAWPAGGHDLYHPFRCDRLGFHGIGRCGTSQSWYRHTTHAACPCLARSVRAQDSATGCYGMGTPGV